MAKRLKSKSGDEVTQAFKDILKERRPSKNLLIKVKGIEMYTLKIYWSNVTSRNLPLNQSDTYFEGGYFSLNGTYNWINILTINMKPRDATKILTEMQLIGDVVRINEANIYLKRGIPSIGIRVILRLLKFT